MSGMVVRKKAEQARMDKAVRRHGSTEPNRLEHKRQDITKAVANIAAEVERTLASTEELRKAGKLSPETENYVRLSIASLSMNASMLNALGLIVDCLSVRYPAKGKNGKSGYTRYSVGLSLDFIYDELESLRHMVQTHTGVKPPADDEDGEEEIEDDREIFDPEEESEVKKK